MPNLTDKEGFAMGMFGPSKMAQILSCRIDALEVPIRAVNLFSSLELTTIGDLAQYSAQEILRMQNVGKKTFRDIRDEIFAKFGVDFWKDFTTAALPRTYARERPKDVQPLAKSIIDSALERHSNAVSQRQWAVEQAVALLNSPATQKEQSSANDAIKTADALLAYVTSGIIA